MNYKLSIFCPLYKGEKFIQGYLEDMLKQSIFPKVQFIILDCNSPENEAQYIKPLLENHSNINYYRLDNDPGLYPAWNVAINLCSAPIIGNWNVDDRKNVHSLEILLKAFERNKDLDVAYGFTYISTIANEKYEDNDYKRIYPCAPHSLSNLIRNNSPHCMPIWKKSLHERFGYFDESYRSAADGEFWLRVAFAGAIMELVNHPVGLYYDNPNGRSTNPETLKECLEEVRKSRAPYWKILAGS